MLHGEERWYKNDGSIAWTVTFENGNLLFGYDYKNGKKEKMDIEALELLWTRTLFARDTFDQ